MRLIAALFVLPFIALAQANEVCGTMQKIDEFKVLGPGFALQSMDWQKVDVLLVFDNPRCKATVKEEIIEVEGKPYRLLRTADDSCDGGNTYGAIYTNDMETPVAHIYDYTVYCEENWNNQYIAK